MKIVSENRLIAKGCREFMNIKKNISLMILAGVLAASLASCAVSSDKEGDQTQGSVEPPQYTTGGGGDITLPTTDPEDVTYETRNETVYVISKNATFRQVSDTTQTAKFGLITEMTRTGYSSSWSKVQYEGTEYYVATSALTADDLLGKSFTSCNKTMYATTDNLNVRKYASAENSFSTSLTTLDKDDAVTVIAEGETAEGETWCKVEVKDGSSTITGYVNSKYLSDSKVGDFLKYFEDLDEPITMYVATDHANMREMPYADDRGTIVILEGDQYKNGLPKGTAVKVVAKGTVENVRWCAVEWKASAGSPARQYYIAESTLTTDPGPSASLEDILAAYPELEEYDEAKTLYINNTVEGEAFGRSTPTRENLDNVVKLLRSKDAVTAYAVGTIVGETSEGKAESRTWCLVQDEEVGFYFVSYDILTTNSDGTPEVIPVSLDELIKNYGFEEVTSNPPMEAIEDVHPWSAPDSSGTELSNVTISAGTTVTVRAKGTTVDGSVENKWYIIEYNGNFYFVIQDAFEIA